ncbi:hypothetical protein JMJ77_0009830 [Colletotrichum scovillei]|uniref:Uncharacterized protein n=1 Tax=Colletotrichum scovillei TaxID=1209932 RepID=A0A9P7QPJ5_9PEZI|nr:hypothetical protein JMJ78_0000015 [Colletotrichum scovillei]KAG7040369.1 hypothetical protein JMJ77_0009830 [Colletotrichum scovillei]KAG7060417.1 hypothetical protein JMJ76_0000851 [Colletotrichum scovillei]
MTSEYYGKFVQARALLFAAHSPAILDCRVQGVTLSTSQGAVCSGRKHLPCQGKSDHMHEERIF